MSITNEVLVNRIRLVRKSRGISQIEMANLLGLSKSTYNRIELGDTPIYDDRLNEILKVLKISLFEIIFAFELDMNDIIKQSKDEIDLASFRDLLQNQIKQNQEILKMLNSKLQHY
ncbi:MAG: helix-turn-helix transcriptional regulator [Flavobacteriales bacterium]|nr:helix-turn-helix transcriptional regulator [Flavobacteriales bacterium]MCB9364075.1 helix-turn-helix transcriptional regulator [Flavobacteriales bacterium]